jgi:hypothetical protein
LIRLIDARMGALLSNLDTLARRFENVSDPAAALWLPVTTKGGSVSQEEILIRGHLRACEVCGRRFTGVRADARYCSNACRQTAYRQRKGNDHE